MNGAAAQADGEAALLEPSFDAASIRFLSGRELTTCPNGDFPRYMRGVVGFDLRTAPALVEPDLWQVVVITSPEFFVRIQVQRQIAVGAFGGNIGRNFRPRAEFRQAVCLANVDKVVRLTALEAVSAICCIPSRRSTQEVGHRM